MPRQVPRDEAAVARNLALGGGTALAERLMLVLSPTLGRPAVQAIVDRAARGESLPSLLAAEPKLAGTDLTQLLDAAGYLGIAGGIVDRALTRARPGMERA